MLFVCSEGGLDAVVANVPPPPPQACSVDKLAAEVRAHVLRWAEASSAEFGAHAAFVDAVQGVVWYRDKTAFRKRTCDFIRDVYDNGNQLFDWRVKHENGAKWTSLLLAQCVDVHGRIGASHATFVCAFKQAKFRQDHNVVVHTFHATIHDSRQFTHRHLALAALVVKAPNANTIDNINRSVLLAMLCGRYRLGYFPNHNTIMGTSCAGLGSSCHSRMNTFRIRFSPV